MTYQLGIDIGTTYTAAALARADGRTQLVQLSNSAALSPSVVWFGQEGSVLVGEAAARRAMTDPEMMVREFKRRIGDPVPLIVNGREQHAHTIAAHVARWVLDRVSAQEGAPPERVAITHPASWGEHRLGLLSAALAHKGIDNPLLLTEPEAAAQSYRQGNPVEAGHHLAVYDLGGGTFDTAVLRGTDTGFVLAGTPDGLDRLGGIDFDEAVFGHVSARFAEELAGLAPEDRMGMAELARLRRECTEAKEALSADTEVTVPVLLRQVRARERLVRAEFEELIRPSLTETIAVLRRTIDSTGLTIDDLDLVLLVGGSTRIPLVTQMLSAELGVRVATDTDPQAAVAVGAAIAAVAAAEADRVSAERTTALAPVSTPDTAPARLPDPVETEVPALARPVEKPRRFTPMRIAVGAAVLAAAALVPIMVPATVKNVVSPENAVSGPAAGTTEAGKETTQEPSMWDRVVSVVSGDEPKPAPKPADKPAPGVTTPPAAPGGEPAKPSGGGNPPPPPTNSPPTNKPPTSSPKPTQTTPKPSTTVAPTTVPPTTIAPTTTQPSPAIPIA